MRGGAVGKGTGYGLDNRGVGLPVPVRTPYVVQTGSGANPAPYPVGTGGFFPGVKAARA
jgi:hypothetical protein